MARCAACQADNLTDSVFCTDCGTKLEAACTSCGAANPPAAKFCRKCGQRLAVDRERPRALPDIPRHLADKILQSKSSLEGERKHVTVLFVDVQGSMDLAERLGAEEWHSILERFFQLLADGVHQYEGTVNQYTGDGIMALFGAPVAHEDHAQRACHATLHLRDQLAGFAGELHRTRGVRFATRMGLNSGDVVVGAIGDDLQMDYTALGHTVGLAQRMDSSRSPAPRSSRRTRRAW